MSTKSFSLLHCSIGLKHEMNIFLRLFEKTGKGKSLNTFLHVHLYGDKKFGFGTSLRVLPVISLLHEMSFPVAHFRSPWQVSQRGHALPQALPVIKKYFPSFCSIFSLSAPLTATLFHVWNFIFNFAAVLNEILGRAIKTYNHLTWSWIVLSRVLRLFYVILIYWGDMRLTYLRILALPVHLQNSFCPDSIHTASLHSLNGVRQNSFTKLLCK